MESGGGYTPPGTHDFEFETMFPGVPGLEWLNKPAAQAIIGAALVIILWWIASRNLKVKPSKGQFAAEYIYEFVRNGIARDILHSDFRRFLPYLLGLFSFLLVNNWFGELFVFMYPTFSNVGYAYGLAILSWLIYIGAGFQKWGFGGFLKKSLIPRAFPATCCRLSSRSSSSRPSSRAPSRWRFVCSPTCSPGTSSCWCSWSAAAS
nr:F0F1 ATP synthase subunit A [Tessaracoccus aquimaris]